MTLPWDDYCDQSIFLQAHFVRVCEMLDHTSGEWKVSVMVGDDQGCRMRVHLSDKVSQSVAGQWAVCMPS